jgi:hypothetical protein
MKRFLKDFWMHLGFWANPAKYIMAEREASWKMYMGELAYMCEEGNVDNIRMYVTHIRRKMEVI